MKFDSPVVSTRHPRSQSLLPAVLLAAFLAQTPARSAPPAGTDKTFNVLPSSTTTLTVADWGFSDSDVPPHTFTGVKIGTLPSAGALRVDGVNATVGQTVSVQLRTPGEVWRARGPLAGWRSVTSSADGTKLAAAALNGQIHTSSDSGATWTPRDSTRTWVSIASSADGTRLAAAAVLGQLYTSTDSGATWTPRETNRSWKHITSSADGTKLAAIVSSGQIYTSADSGASWTARDSSRQWAGIASSADGARLVAVVSGGQIYTSPDSGVTWTPRATNRPWQAVASSADGTRLVAAASVGQVYTSSDSGVTWTARDANRSWNFLASSADGTRLAAVLEGGQIMISADSGVTWTARESSRTWWSIASSADGTKLAAVGNGTNVYVSTDAAPVITYTAPAGTGTVNFAFQVQDSATTGNLDPVANLLTFSYFNANPVFSGYVLRTSQSVGVTVTKASILARVTDPDGGTPSINAVATGSAHGGSISSLGSEISYFPPPLFRGIDTFGIVFSDGQGGFTTETIYALVTAPDGAAPANPLTIQPGGSVALLLTGTPGQPYLVQRSTNLQNWTTIRTVVAGPDGSVPATDSAPPPANGVYYRLAIGN